jgi:hypothetical protein
MNEQKMAEHIKLFDKFDMTREMGLAKTLNIKLITVDKQQFI